MLQHSRSTGADHNDIVRHGNKHISCIIQDGEIFFPFRLMIMMRSIHRRSCCTMVWLLPLKIAHQDREQAKHKGEGANNDNDEIF